MSTEKIEINAVKCNHCGQVIKSAHRHDMVDCNCPRESGCQISVDGGVDYRRRVGGKNSDYQEIHTEEEYKRLMDEMKREKSE